MKYYHGTSSNCPVGRTLLPPHKTGILRENFRNKNLDCVFLTTSLRSAEMYSKKAVARFGGFPVIYEAKPVGRFFMNGIECVCKKAKIL